MNWSSNRFDSNSNCGASESRVTGRTRRRTRAKLRRKYCTRLVCIGRIGRWADSNFKISVISRRGQIARQSARHDTRAGARTLPGRSATRFDGCCTWPRHGMAGRERYRQWPGWKASSSSRAFLCTYARARARTRAEVEGEQILNVLA